MQTDMLQPVAYTVNSLRYTRANKRTLVASVYVLPRAVPWLQFTVGQKRRKTPKHDWLMVPVGLKRVQGRGRVLNRRLAQRYRAQLLGDGHHFEVEGGVGQITPGIYKRDKDGGISLVVLYIKEANYNRTWDFYENVARNAAREFPGQLRLSLTHALRTSRPRGGGL